MDISVRIKGVSFEAARGKADCGGFAPLRVRNLPEVKRFVTSNF